MLPSTTTKKESLLKTYGTSLLSEEHGSRAENGDNIILNDPLGCYNYFIDCYNKPENRVAETMILRPLPDNKVYHLVWSVINSFYHRCFLYILALFFPLVGLAILSILLYTLAYFYRCRKISEDNAGKVSNPLQNMILCPEICNQNGSSIVFYEIEVAQLASLPLPEQAKQQLKGKVYEGKVRFMVYNQEFASFYTDFEMFGRLLVSIIIRVFALAFLNLVIYFEVLFGNYTLF